MNNTGNNCCIPVLKVMNTAHQLIAHMLMHTDRVEQTTYDVMAYNLLNRDWQLTMLSMIVLIAMVSRTDGVRVRKLRSAMLDERTDDFYEGLSLYEQFINNAEEYFCEDDFLIDVAEMVLAIRQQQEQIQQKDEELQQLKQQNKELMENQQRNAPVINVAGNYIDIHDNQHCNIYATEPKSEAPCPTAEQDAPQTGDCSFFGTDKYPADICEKNLREAIDNAKSKADACRNIMTLDSCGYIHIRQLTDAQKAELLNPFAAPKYMFTRQDFAKARNR